MLAQRLLVAVREHSGPGDSRTLSKGVLSPVSGRGTIPSHLGRWSVPSRTLPLECVRARACARTEGDLTGLVGGT